MSQIQKPKRRIKNKIFDKPVIVTRGVYPKHLSKTNHSRSTTIPTEVALQWEGILGHPLSQVYVRLDEILTVSPTPFQSGFYIERNVYKHQWTEKGIHSVIWRFVLPTEWLTFHEQGGWTVTKVLLQLGKTLKIAPKLSKSDSPQPSLKTLEAQ